MFALNPKLFQKNTSLFEKFFSFKTILSAQGKPFRQTFQKTSAKKVGNWQNGSSNIRKGDKIWSPWYVIFSLEKAAKSFMGNLPGFFAQSLKNTKKCFFILTLFFFKKFLWANRTEIWHSCRLFAENLKLFRSNSEIH